MCKKIKETSFIDIDRTDLGSWFGLVEDYSLRNLTRDGDKLPALSGIAQVYQELNKDKYLAGLWLSMLLEHLCWCVPSVITDTHRPVSYMAPTWSWASLGGKVIFDRSPPTRNIKIVEATTAPTGQDPLGQVRGGSITLEARLNKQHWKRDLDLKGKCYYARDPTYEQGTFPSRMTTNSEPISTATLLLDIQDSTKRELELWSLTIHDQFALALQAVDSGEHNFKRIGAICWRSKKDDENWCDPTILTII